MELAKKQLKELLNVDDSKISIPPDSNMGDYSTTIAFDLAKEKKENPTITAIKLISELDLSKTIFSKVKAYGPYINFFLDRQKVFSKVLKQVLREKKDYGSLKNKKKNILLEFVSPNTNKPLHLGHVLQMSLGQSLSRIIETQGYNIIRLIVYNDRGIHICKSMLAYQKWGRNKKPVKGEKGDEFVGKYYVLYDEKKSAKLEKELHKMLIKWEEGDKEVRRLWKRMNKWCYKGLKKTMKNFGLEKFDKEYFESKIYNKGKEIVHEGLKKGVFEKEKDGGVFVDLTDLGKKFVQRKDGTALYATQDIALAKLKAKDFKFERSIIMTGNEQNHYFKQLFKIFEKLNYSFADKYRHVGTGMINLPSGRMKSREGTVVDGDDLIDEMIELANKEVKDRKSRVSKKDTRSIALAAIKYYLLKVNSRKDTIFNPKDSINFEGDTGPYLLYSLVRANKIIKKSKIKLNSRVKSKLYKSDYEFELIKKISEFPKIISESAETLSPHTLCHYANKLAGDFNAFYDKIPVLQVEDKRLKTARLKLVKAYSIIMQKCLFLLGIEPVKKM